MPSFKDHFSTKSDNYAAHRPTYPPELVNQLAAISPARDLALDCGCGTGQLSVLLADRFNRVFATDASAAQIAEAQPHQRVTYEVAPAHESGLPDSCVDLITVAQAAHWFDLESFYAEARRVARPNAVIALITYGVLHVAADEPERLVQQFYYKTIGPYWPPERSHVEEGYQRLPFPFKEISLPTMSIIRHWDVNELLGYIKTWSAVKAAQKASADNLITNFEQTLRHAWGDSAIKREVSWPLSRRTH